MTAKYQTRLGKPLARQTFMVAEVPNISEIARRVLEAFVGLCESSESVTISRDRVVEHVGELRLQIVDRAVRELCRTGLIRIDLRPGHASRYVVDPNVLEIARKRGKTRGQAYYGSDEWNTLPTWADASFLGDDVDTCSRIDAPRMTVTEAFKALREAGAFVTLGVDNMLWLHGPNRKLPRLRDRLSEGNVIESMIAWLQEHQEPLVLQIAQRLLVQ